MKSVDEIKFLKRKIRSTERFPRAPIKIANALIDLKLKPKDCHVFTIFYDHRVFNLQKCFWKLVKRRRKGKIIPEL